MPDCKNCTEKCPQAERAHEIALGRMYATKELVELIKKLESGQLVEVVRCEECYRWEETKENPALGFCSLYPLRLAKKATGFCELGERRQT